jgi:hypothetical protein
MTERVSSDDTMNLKLWLETNRSIIENSVSNARVYQFVCDLLDARERIKELEKERDEAKAALEWLEERYPIDVSRALEAVRTANAATRAAEDKP